MTALLEHLDLFFSALEPLPPPFLPGYYAYVASDWGVNQTSELVGGLYLYYFPALVLLLFSLEVLSESYKSFLLVTQSTAPKIIM